MEVHGVEMTINDGGASNVLSRYVSLYISHLAQAALLNSGRPMHTYEVKDAIANEVEVSVDYLRRELHSSAALVFHKRHWELRWRLEAPHSPIEGILESILKSLGYPVVIEKLCEWVSSAGKGDVGTTAEIVPGLLRARKETFWEVSDGEFGLREWLPDFSSCNEEDVIADNFFGEEERIRKLLERVDEFALDWDAGLKEVCRKLIDRLGMPLPHREIILICWRGLKRSGDAEAIFRELLKGEGLHIISQGYWCTDSLIEKLRGLALEQSKEMGEVAEKTRKDLNRLVKRAYSIAQRTRAQPLPITSEDWDNLIDWLKDRPARLDVILSEWLELDPTNEAYLPTLYELRERMAKDVRFISLGNHRWWLRERVPSWVAATPRELLPEPPRAHLKEDGTHAIEIELPDSALEPELLQWINAPEYEDVGEPVSVQSVPKGKRTALIPVPYHHIVAGTMRIRHIDRWLFHDDDMVQYYIATDDEGSEFPVWVNLESGLMFGLKEWYKRHGVVVGAVIKVERDSDRLKLTWDGKYDRHLHIPSSRVNQLINYAKQEAVIKASVLELMQSLVMLFYEDGIHFIRLWSEINILRRTSKRLIASNLSLYSCFIRHPKRSDYWLYDYERSAEGIRQEKRRLVERLLKQGVRGAS